MFQGLGEVPLFLHLLWDTGCLWIMHPKEYTIFRTISCGRVPWPAMALGYRKVGRMQADVRGPQMCVHRDHGHDFQLPVGVAAGAYSGARAELHGLQ